jgi:type II secretory pathway pseudopilin PulG
MSLRREQLLGFLLGALERAEHEQVERELAANPQLRQELAEIRAVLEKVGMDQLPEPLEPPAGLAERTCQFVAAKAENAAPVALPPERGAGASSRAYTFTDVLVAASVLLVLGALVFPSLVRSRFLARLTACQNNLRQIGMAMWQDSELGPDQRYSRIPWEDDRAVAGMMGSILVEKQLLANPDALICPTSDLAVLLPGFRNPTITQIRNASGQEMIRLQQIAGGSLAYPLGFTQGGRIVPPRNTYREGYCLVGEAPAAEVGNAKSASHDGRGGNIFFEDGHIRWIEDSGYSLLPDHPYRNRQGQAAPGVDQDDAVLGGSDMHPTPVVFPLRPQP